MILNTNCICPAKRSSPYFSGVEQTWNIKQTDIVAAVDVGVADKAFDLRLPDLGPYSIDFTRSGRHLLLGGRWVCVHECTCYACMRVCACVYDCVNACLREFMSLAHANFTSDFAGDSACL